MSLPAQRKLSGKQVVVLGCGYVGTAVARAAHAEGARVTALTRNPVTAAALEADGVAVVTADLAGEAWHGAIGAAGALVLNCVSSGGGGLDAYRHSYGGGMESTLAWAGRRGPADTIVYTSSTSVYPQGGGATVDETAPTDGAGERGAILRAAEARLEAAGQGVCARWFVLRLAGIYGPERHHFVDQVRAGEAAGTGEHRMNLIHRDDIVTAVLAAWTAPTEVGSAICNGADDAPARKAEVVAWVAERLGVPVPRFSGEALSVRRGQTPDRVIANGKLKRVLGWQPRFPTFREGCESFLSRRPGPAR
jgi:nucleoside-diphosphate-sugar epimerase